MNTVAQKTNTMNKLTFGQRLVQIRKAMGLTQTELGNRIGASQRIIHHYENKAEYPPTPKLIELAHVLNTGIRPQVSQDLQKNSDMKRLAKKAVTSN